MGIDDGAQHHISEFLKGGGILGSKDKEDATGSALDMQSA